MGALQRFEQRLESAVSGAFARAFRSAVQPVEIAAALQRELDNSVQVLSRERYLVPNSFTIALSKTDFERLSPYGSTLSSELDRMVHEHVNDQRYTLAGPLRMEFVEMDTLPTGQFRVKSHAEASVTPQAGQRMTETAVNKAVVLLEVNGVRRPLQPPGVVIGRGTDADLRINDPGVSRRHAELRIAVTNRMVSVSIVDLGSTNGILVDGERVTHALLKDGSQIVMGSTTMTVRNPHTAGSD